MPSADVLNEPLSSITISSINGETGSKTRSSPSCDDHNNNNNLDNTNNNVVLPPRDALPAPGVELRPQLPAPARVAGSESVGAASPPLIASSQAPGPPGPALAAHKSLAYDYPKAPPSYPPLTPLLHRSPITILSTQEKGRGVYATEDLPTGFLVDISPVLLLSNDEYYGGGKEGDGRGVEGSVLRGYVFTWKGREGGMALALGVGSLFNHSISPNVSFELNTTTYTIHYKTFRPVLAGEELCIFYGHKTRFDGDDSRVDLADSDDESPWGGFDRIGTVASDKAPKKKWDEQIVPFAELEWKKVTSIIDPEDQPLVLLDCWAVDIPARHAQLAFQFGKKNSQKFSELGHLKRVRKAEPAPGAPDATEAMIAVLLFSVESAPADFRERLAKSPLAALDPVPYIVSVPSMIARTDAQAAEWGNVWPVTMCHIREGPKALPRGKGWEQIKRAWIKREGERVWKAAKDAAARGEHPIACHVTDTFNPDVHSPSYLPKTLVRAHDTRLSTHNVLSHAASNAIDAVAVLDRQGLRDEALLPTLPAPYLLTGLTVFMSHEPCLLCAMSLLHSRIANLFYIKRAPGGGGCGSVYSVHEDQGLNHRFDVWEWKADGRSSTGVGAGLDLLLDP